MKTRSLEEQRASRKRKQDACDHPEEGHYPLTASDYVLCCGCGLQFEKVLDCTQERCVCQDENCPFNTVGFDEEE